MTHVYATVRYITCFGVLLLMSILPTYAQENTSDLILGGGTGELVYSSNRDNTTSIFTINTDGTNVRRLTDAPSVEDWTPSWSPDGESIVFNRHNIGLYVIDYSGENLEVLTEEDDYAPMWSPNGEMMAFASWRGGNLQTYVLDIASGEVTMLADFYSYSPSWSPDGESLIFIGDNNGDNLYIVSPVGGDATTFFPLSGELGVPVMSPDGKLIALQFTDDNFISQLAILNLATEEVRFLGEADFDYLSPSWSPDGEWLAFHRRSIGGGVCDEFNQVYIIDILGENLQQVTTEGGCFADWRPPPSED